MKLSSQDKFLYSPYSISSSISKTLPIVTYMHLIIDLCVVPMGVGVSVSPYITECQKIIEKADLKYRMHAYGTNIEGEWDELMQVVKACHEKVHDMGAPRINTTIKMGTRTDRTQSMEDKIKSVEDKLTK